MPCTKPGLSPIERCDYLQSFLLYSPKYPEKTRSYYYRALKHHIISHLIGADDWLPSPLIKKFQRETIEGLLFKNSRTQLCLNADDFRLLKKRLKRKPRLAKKYLTKKVEVSECSGSAPY